MNDSPSEESRSRAMLAGLRRARERLLERPVRDLAAVLGTVGARFLEAGDPLRREALELLPSDAGISDAMARAVLDGMAVDWSSERLLALLNAELDDGSALDGFVRDQSGRRTRALGFALSVHVCAGTVPGVSVTSMIRALLCKSAVLLKPGAGDRVLPALFQRGFTEADPTLAAASAVAYWQGGSGDPMERIALAEADLVVVYGGEEAVTRVRALARATTPVVVYPHRVSFAVVGRSGLGSAAPDAAKAVALFDQRGCVSPHAFYVLAPEAEAELFAAGLARELARLEDELPSGTLEAAESSRLQQLRGTAEMESAAGRGRMWSGGQFSWTVLFSPDASFEPSCLGRTVRVVAVDSVEKVLESAAPFRRYLQTVGVHGLSVDESERLADGLARLGAVRIAPLARAPWPPPWWHHDGAGPLRAMLRWTDFEES